MGRCDMLRDFLQAMENTVPHFQIKCADSADQFDFIRNDVLPDTTFDRTKADHYGRPRQIGAAADEGLRRADDIGRDHNRVNSTPGP